PQYSAPSRVCTEASSVSLSQWIASSADPVKGTVMEVGCGCGIQLFTAALSHPEVTRALGYDLDPRQINVARFGAHMNGLADRVEIFSDENMFFSSVDCNSVSMGIAPSFLPSLEFLPLDFGSMGEEAFKRFGALQGERPVFSMKEFYGQTGWGGPDGLTVTLPLIEKLLPYLKPRGTLITCADFAMSEGQPLLISVLANNLPFSFEYRIDEGDNRTPGEWAATVRKEIYDQFPELRSPKNTRRIRNSVLANCLEHGIESYQGGVLALYPQKDKL
ncbi:MAG: 50S ribosomal protein L11 methyltransferase, partial [Bdellovibrionales bacterium]|nr:50S ribosomal protein L11 methyltransferase [Bdellovibrionales bacterium]